MQISYLFDRPDRLLFTEKTTLLLETNKYTFEVDPKLTKTRIRYFFAKFYDLKIKKINTRQVPPSRKRFLSSKGINKYTKRITISFSVDQLLPENFYIEINS